jgi:hypothetical protein
MPSSVYVSGRSEESRSRHVDELNARAAATRFVDIERQEPGQFSLVDGDMVRLRSPRELKAFWVDYAQTASAVYLDITGLAHHVWAPLVTSGLAAGVPLNVVYVEPLKYRRNEISSGSDLFDLTVGLGGMSPLPGFLSLAEPDEDEFLFVPLLGFEGRRFSYLMSEVAPAGDRVVPIIGVPGFQPEFVGFAYDGNRIPLLDNDAWQRVRFAVANCPFAVFYELEAIAQANPQSFLKIAPIGTKPHGLGAVLFALAYPDLVELVYDHPLRKEKSTEGAARLLVYDVGALATWRAIA